MNLLVRCVSNNGNFLLDIGALPLWPERAFGASSLSVVPLALCAYRFAGPASDGSIPTIMQVDPLANQFCHAGFQCCLCGSLQERLLQIGAWMQVSSVAIYSTTYWRVQYEGDHPSFCSLALVLCSPVNSLGGASGTGIDDTNVRYTTKNG